MRLLEEDNEKDIYFDIKYDNTFYDLLNDYSDTIDIQLAQLGEVTAIPDAELDEAKKNILTQLLEENIGLDRNSALFEAESIMSGKRLVRDNDYCVLEIDNNRIYYIREMTVG